MVGVVLAAAAIVLISFGFNNLNRWGLGLAGPNAPFNVLGLSPAPIMIVRGHRARPGVHDVDAQAPGRWEDAAPCARSDRFAAGAGCGLRDVFRRRAGGHAQFLRAALYPDRAGPFAARHGDRHDAVQPHGVLRGDADRPVLRQADASADRTLRLHPLYARAGVARLRRAQRLERRSRAVRPRPVRHRAGFAGHVAVQRAGHRLAQGARR